MNDLDTTLTNHILGIYGVEHNALIREFRKHKMLKFSDCKNFIIDKKDLHKVNETSEKLMCLYKGYMEAYDN